LTPTEVVAVDARIRGHIGTVKHNNNNNMYM